MVHEGYKPHQCPLCSLNFSTQSRVQVHRETVHEGKKPFSCPVCDWRFADVGTMNKHISAVHAR